MSSSTAASTAASAAGAGAEKENGENNQNKPNSAAPPPAAPATSKGHFEAHSYVGPYRLEKTLGKGQTGRIERKKTPSKRAAEAYGVVRKFCQFSALLLVIQVVR